MSARYWDSSALIAAYTDSRVEMLTQEPEQFTRVHSLAEMFSTLTGGRLGFQLHPADAAAIVRELTGRMSFVELNAEETADALDEAEKRGVRGGNVHDWLHATAARKAKAKTLLTFNLSDFENLADGFTVKAP